MSFYTELSSRLQFASRFYSLFCRYNLRRYVLNENITLSTLDVNITELQSQAYENGASLHDTLTREWTEIRVAAIEANIPIDLVFHGEDGWEWTEARILIYNASGSLDVVRSYNWTMSQARAFQLYLPAEIAASREWTDAELTILSAFEDWELATTQDWSELAVSYLGENQRQNEQIFFNLEMINLIGYMHQAFSHQEEEARANFLLLSYQSLRDAHIFDNEMVTLRQFESFYHDHGDYINTLFNRSTDIHALLRSVIVLNTLLRIYFDEPGDNQTIISIPIDDEADNGNLVIVRRADYVGYADDGSDNDESGSHTPTSYSLSDYSSDSDISGGLYLSDSSGFY